MIILGLTFFFFNAILCVSLCFHIISQGAGKSHVVELLGEVGFFPLDTFVRVDPDRLRRELPEMQAYLQRDPGTAGSLTHKEVRDFTVLSQERRCFEPNYSTMLHTCYTHFIPIVGVGKRGAY